MDNPPDDPVCGRESFETAAAPHQASGFRETARAIGRGTAVIVGVGLLNKVLAQGKEVLMVVRFGAEAKWTPSTSPTPFPAWST